MSGTQPILSTDTCIAASNECVEISPFMTKFPLDLNPVSFTIKRCSRHRKLTSLTILKVAIAKLSDGFL